MYYFQYQSKHAGESSPWPLFVLCRGHPGADVLTLTQPYRLSCTMFAPNGQNQAVFLKLTCLVLLRDVAH
uniref:Uncharacterized protein n=1 Tax=Anguilla anguilla TaxID=7936 RepID=A0A0E9XDB7_ANGAN